MVEEKIIGLLFVIMALFILLAVFFYKLLRQNQSNNEQLSDIARSLRILAKAPKDFEEGQVIKKLQDKHQSPFD